jgi:uncharacterized protein
VGAAAIGGLAWARYETELFALREATVPVLPPGQDDLRVLHISDLHLTPSQHSKIEWVRSLADLQPDLIIDTGDNMAHLGALEPLLYALAPLMKIPGAFVMGSNDYYAPAPKNPAHYLREDARVSRAEPQELPADHLAAALVTAGWKDLTNRRDKTVADGRVISLAGVDDPHLDRDKFPLADSDTGSTADLHLGVAHAPYLRVLDEMYFDGADLILAGHTHGGQLCVPFYGALVTNCDLDRGRAKGLHGWPGPRPDQPNGAASTWLNVCAGLGTSPYAPVRFACRPEAVLLTLTSR